MKWVFVSLLCILSLTACDQMNSSQDGACGSIAYEIDDFAPRALIYPDGESRKSRLFVCTDSCFYAEEVEDGSNQSFVSCDFPIEDYSVP